MLTKPKIFVTRDDYTILIVKGAKFRIFFLSPRLYTSVIRRIGKLANNIQKCIKLLSFKGYTTFLISFSLHYSLVLNENAFLEIL